MYKEFYGLTTYPFSLTPDPQFFYLSKNHEHCLRSMLYSLEQGQGLTVLIGDIGTGKTLLINALVESLDRKTRVVFLAHSYLESPGMKVYDPKELRLEITGRSQAKLLFNLKNFLRLCEKRNEKVVLIIDEAHNLSSDIVEELFLLTQFDTHGEKLVQIVFAGQLPFQQMLILPELAHLSQRIDCICCLLPMDYSETKNYIEKRLHVSGATYTIFLPEAIKKIFACSQGIPRVINLICNSALVYGLGYEKPKIEHTIIQQVVQELHVYIPQTPPDHPPHHVHDQHGRHTNGTTPPQNAQAPEFTTPLHAPEDMQWLEERPRQHGSKRSQRLALVTGLGVASLLMAVFVLHTLLSGGKLRESLAGSTLSPLMVSAPSAGWREQPLLPQSAGWREQPLLPQSAGRRAQSKTMHWGQTTMAYQLPAGKPVTVSLPALQRLPADLPVNVRLDVAESIPSWLKFDPEKFVLSGTPPLQEVGKTYYFTLRARTADGLESLLQIVASPIVYKGL